MYHQYITIWNFLKLYSNVYEVKMVHHMPASVAQLDAHPTGDQEVAA